MITRALLQVAAVVTGMVAGLVLAGSFCNPLTMGRPSLEGL
jgi:hypothetical protein